MSDIKSLTDSVEKLTDELRTRVEALETKSGDALDQAAIQAVKDELGAELKSLRDAVADANTPSVEETAEQLEAKYKEAFGAYLAGGERAGSREGNELKVKDISLNIASEGGVFLPKVFSGTMTDLLRKASPIRARARVIQSGQNFVHPLKTAKGTAGLRSEKGTIAPESSQAFDLMTFVPQEINARQQATAWAHDGDAQANLVNMLMEDIAASLGEKEGDFFLNGTNQNTLASGGNVKTGILAGTRLLGADRFTNTNGSLAGIETEAADVITFDDVLKLRSTLHGKYLAGATYITDAATELELLLLKDANGRYLITNGDVTGSAGKTIFGNGYVVDDNMASAVGGDGARLVLADLSKYVIVDHSGVRWIANPYSDYTMVEYFAGRRTAGGVSDAQAFRALYNKGA